MAQMGFFDLPDRYASLDTKKDPLLEIDAVVPWEEFRPALERVWRKPDADRKSRAGRKPIDPVLMFKMLILSTLYNLSDDQIEHQIRDTLNACGYPSPTSRDRADNSTNPKAAYVSGWPHPRASPLKRWSSARWTGPLSALRHATRGWHYLRRPSIHLRPVINHLPIISRAD